MAEATHPQSATAADDFDRVRIRREALRSAGERLATALAAPMPGRVDLWWAGVVPAAAELAESFADHVAETESPDGLFEEVIEAAPRLSNSIDHLVAEHREIEIALARITQAEAPSTPEAISVHRETALEVLAMLTRHRFLGADLLFEAYNVDIGAAD
jgi:hypothetical protein